MTKIKIKMNHVIQYIDTTPHMLARGGGNDSLLCEQRDFLLADMWLILVEYSDKKDVWPKGNSDKKISDKWCSDQKVSDQLYSDIRVSEEKTSGHNHPGTHGTIHGSI